MHHLVCHLRRAAIAALLLVVVAACGGSESTAPAAAIPAPDAAPTAAVAGAVNLLENPTFETGTTAPTGWSSQFWGTTPVFTYPATGRTGRGATVTQRVTSTGDARWQHNAVSVTAGARYTYSVWYRSNVATTLVAAYTSSTGAMSYAGLASLPSSANGWVQQTSTFTVPSGVVRVTVYVAITRAGSVTIDDASLTAADAVVPAPTVSLSASAGQVTAGQSVTLTWSSSNATACTASGAWTGARVLSGTQSITPSATGTYTLTCTGTGGSAAQSAAVVVGSTTTGPFTQGMVSLTFDDAWDSQYVNALPLLQAAGYKATFYLTTVPIEQRWTFFMTPAMVQDIAAKGHEIAGHTLVHPDLTVISADSLRAELTRSRTYLQTLTGQPVTSFAYPFGRSTAAIQTAVASAGYTSGRGVTFTAQNVATSPKYNLFSMCIDPANTVDVVKAQIDAAMANRTWFILCFHDVKLGGDNLSITPANLQAILDHLRLRGTRVVTVAEGRALMAP